VRIWDISPAYLNRASLLGEHRELHGILVILEQGRAGYARHPETMRWRRHLGALRMRHRLLAAEMVLRGYRDLSPVRRAGTRWSWPSIYIDSPGAQFALLSAKYSEREPGRIHLPRSCQELWAAHKYSVLARDQSAYRAIGRAVAGLRRRSSIEPLALDLVELLRRPPRAGDLENALLHMWGHVGAGKADGPPAASRALLIEIQRRAVTRREPYLMSGTALSELAAWLPRVSYAGGRAVHQSAPVSTPSRRPVRQL
jgi:Pyrimidine dimer DNA glycosylase/Protein of unknown function (DUF1722)